jgi:hypothetical protein
MVSRPLDGPCAVAVLRSCSRGHSHRPGELATKAGNDKTASALAPEMSVPPIRVLKQSGKQIRATVDIQERRSLTGDLAAVKTLGRLSEYEVLKVSMEREQPCQMLACVKHPRLHGIPRKI